VILTLAYCGLRWGELAALRVDSVDLTRRRLEVGESVTEVRGHLVWGSPKTHQHRTVPIPAFLARELAAHIHSKDPSGLLFTTRRGAVLRNLNFRRDVFDDAATAAGLPGLTPHELRHTAASLAISAGANVKTVQRMLGHASAAMTLDVYSRIFDDDLDRVAEELDAHGVCTPCAFRKTTSPRTDIRSPVTCGFMEPPEGIEPSTYALRVRRSGRLS
jgi:integrase